MVVGVDLTDYSHIVIEHALDQAARHQAPELHFVYVKERRRGTVGELGEQLAAAVYPALQVFNQYGTDWHARLHVRRGKPDQQITILAADVLADLIVIGQFGLHRKRLPNRVLAAAVSPTLVVGMPHMLDMEQCFACAAMREDNLGWFCEDHKEKQHAVSPATVWSNGNLMI
jgi:nucleotide-binding universal stress UspA family protein